MSSEALNEKLREAVFKVPGFIANGINCGIKEQGKKDLALIFSKDPAQAAGVFTTNAFKAAPVLVCRERIASGRGQAIIANSGNANAATGEEGRRTAIAMTKRAADELGIGEQLVYVASTGIIGQELPRDTVLRAVPRLVSGLDENGIARAQEAIMTTDKFPKIASAKFPIGGREISVCAIAKGAGMIEPHMATLLAFVMTDLAIDGGRLERVFRQAVEVSFNAISVDGCMSTNDTALIFANSAAGNRALTSRDASRFRQCLSGVLSELARSMVIDGEGATKAVEIAVEGARSVKEARQVAYSISRSSLVKTAFFGEDPNWGRIISAAGASGAPINADNVDVLIEGIAVFGGGKGRQADMAALTDIMRKDSFKVMVRLGMGKSAFRMITSDLTYDYVKINAQYHT